jgi:hypothetical protein
MPTKLIMKNKRGRLEEKIVIFISTHIEAIERYVEQLHCALCDIAHLCITVWKGCWPIWSYLIHIIRREGRGEMEGRRREGEGGEEAEKGEYLNTGR